MHLMAGLIVANAPLVWNEELAALATVADPLLAADGGANALARIGLKATAVVGDMDSILPETCAWLGEGRLVIRPDQDTTDLEKTLAYALEELHLDSLTVLAALGGRIDHAIHNLGLLVRYRLGRRLLFRGAVEELVAHGGELEHPASAGETWSFWTFDPDVRVTLEGVRWPLQRSPLDPGGRPSTSNMAIGDRVRVVAEGGAVVVMRYLNRPK